LWVGTSAGLHRWESGKLRTWTTRDGLFAANIRALHAIRWNAWIGTLGGGLSRMKDGRFINITTREGLTDDSISQILADDFRCAMAGLRSRPHANRAA
jgi:ligand-binding sensor domain-containing protein